MHTSKMQMQKLYDIGIEQCTLRILRKKEKPQYQPQGNYNTFTMMRSIRARACCFAVTFGKHG
jgi:hypothetical protein